MSDHDESMDMFAVVESATHSGVEEDPWTELRQYTAARLALGRTGASLPTQEVLAFALAHAKARDAVHEALDVDALATRVEGLELSTLRVHSAAEDRTQYLMRPDLGRRLSEQDRERLQQQADAQPDKRRDLLLVIGDGLSSPAVERHAVPLIEAVLAQRAAGWAVGPVVLASQSRVALADQVGEILRAECVAMLIGERPGLSSPDSLGVYLTYQPRLGRSDAERNCISNVRPAGLSYAAAAARLWWLCENARRLGKSGVALKDGSGSDEQVRLTND